MSLLALALLLPAPQDAEVRISIQTRDGNAVTGVTDVKSITMESSLGKTVIQLKDVNTLWFSKDRVSVGTNDGTTLTGKISQASWKVKTRLGEFTISSEDIHTISVLGVAVPPTPPPPRPGAAGQSAPAPKPPPPPGLTPSKILRLGTVVTRFLRTPDGKRLVLLDAADSKVIVVDLQSLGQEKEIPLAGGEIALSLSPGGDVLVAAGQKMIKILSLSQGKVLRTFPIEIEVSDVCALDDRTAIASTVNEAFIVSIPKQSVVSRLQGARGKRFFVSSDGRRIYGGGCLILPPDKAAGRGDFTTIQVPWASSFPFGDWTMSPDGRFAIEPIGTVYRLGKCAAASVVAAAQVDSHQTAAWAPAARKLFLFTLQGFVKELDTETFKPLKTWNLGYRFQAALVDEAGTWLIGLGQPAGPTPAPWRPDGKLSEVADLFRFELPRQP